jgi:methionine-rich copper-binding protein CopC/putative copper export protein
MRLLLNKPFLSAFGLGLVLAIVPGVYAHAKLVRSLPAANANLKDAPKKVELWFSEELEPQFSTIIVSDQSGKHVDRNDMSLAEGNRKLQISLEDLPSGTYSVDWRTLSTDQHTMKGKFTLSVTATVLAAQTSPPPRSAASIGQPTPGISPATTTKTESFQESGSSWAQSVVRWFEYLAMMTLFGGFAFYLFVLKPALLLSGSTKTDGVVESAAGAERVVQFSGICIALLVIANCAELVLQASAVFDKTVSEVLSPALLRQLITKTLFGTSWLWQGASIIALLIVIFFLSRQLKGTSPNGFVLLWWAGLAVSGLLMVAPTLIGHAAAMAKEYPFARTTDWLHLAAAGVWVGGLFHLALTMPKVLSTLETRDRLRLLHRVIPLFTRLAVVSTVLIVLTGVYSSWMHVDGFGKCGAPTTATTLFLKVLLVVPMLVLGGVNTFVIHPRVSV